MDPQIKLGLFVPLYNVVDTAVEVLEAIPPAAFERLTWVILIDNGSTDGTRERILKWLKENRASKFRLYFNERNVSLGGSTRIAFKLSRELELDWLICLHSDGQADPRDLLKFMSVIRHDLDFVLGNRFYRCRKPSGYSWPRYLGNLFFNLIQSLIVRRATSDLGAFIAFNLHSLRGRSLRDIPLDMAFHPLLIMKMLKQDPNLRIAEVPISWGAIEKSNVTAWRYGLKLLFQLSRLSLGLAYWNQTDPILLRTHEQFGTESRSK